PYTSLSIDQCCECLLIHQNLAKRSVYIPTGQSEREREREDLTVQII
ncbi:MAG: hypothetical protein ACI90V_009168, partial [Bacillariaceae sp.]